MALFVPQCVPKLKLFCIIDSLQDKLNQNTSMQPQKNVQQAYWNDDLGIIIGANQVFTNQKLSKH